MNTGALIIASQNSQEAYRDNEEMPVYLPMQHIDGTTVVKREIFTLRKAGVTPIFVLCGYQQEVLRNHLSHNGVIFCEDAEFQDHSFEESLEIGLAAAREQCDRVLIIPVEYPAFSSDTVEQLMNCSCHTIPTFDGRRGYPQLYVFEEHVGTSTKEARKEEKEETEEPADPDGRDEPDTGNVKMLPVQDEGILYSIAEEGGLERVLAYTRSRRAANPLSMKLKVTLTKETEFFGPGVYELLSGIEETGSISAAAAKMEMSYTKCWKMINKAEEEMGFRFVDRTKGGKNGGQSSLTQEARTFLDRYRALTEDLGRMSRNFFDAYFGEFQ
jgi:molybdate transport repressor ModE-like protein